jgi:DNA-binding response OmpR family regulator
MVSKILLVEDDKDLQESLKELFVEAGYFVKTASDGVEALKQVNNNEFDLVILDLGLPIMSGESVCLEIRKKFPDMRIIILTAKDTTPDIISGLNLGADDYITKPFVVDELLARVKARLRFRSGQEETLTVADLVLNGSTYEVKRGNTEIKLTPQEFKLLQCLMSNKGRVLTRDTILNKVWLYAQDVETRVVDVYMGYLRKKIDAQSSKKLIHSVRGFGYVIKE